MTPSEVADSFVEAINSGDVDRLVALMTREHIFVDADGSEHVGRDGVSASWRKYFELVPNFRIEVFHRFEDTNTVVLLGEASGTFIESGALEPRNHWTVPAAWRVVVESDRVAIWQLYANQHQMYEILERIRTA